MYFYLLLEYMYQLTSYDHSIKSTNLIKEIVYVFFILLDLLSRF